MSDIDEVKSRLNIVDVVGERVQLKKAGRNFKALCPFHSEKTPSFIVSPERQTFHCFGCGKGGSVIDFVMEFDHVDFPEALETLAEKAGVKLTRRAPDTAEGKLKQKLYEVNHLASEFYHYLLTKHRLGETARLYLKNRGISDKSIATFTLGYSPNSWDGLMKFLRKKGYDEDLMEKAGLIVRRQTSDVRYQTNTIQIRSPKSDLRNPGYYDRFRGRVMFTLKDHRGQVVGFAGRVLDPDVKEAKYINTSETPVYVKSNVLYGLDVTKDAISRANEAVVMEGELDVISSFQAGIPNVVAIKGSALTEGHVRLLRRFAERLTLALDSDVAGDAAARRGIEIAESAGFDMRVVRLASGKDPDEAARQNPGLLKKAIKDAIPVYDYFIDSAVKRFDVATAYGKKKVSDELLPILGKIDNAIVQAHYIKKLAKTLDVAEETIGDGMEKMKRAAARGVPPGEPTAQRSLRTRPEKLEVYLLGLTLQGHTADLFGELQSAIDVTQFEQSAVRHIFERLGVFMKGHKTFDIEEFAKTISVELLSTLDEAYLWDIADMGEDEDKFKLEWAVAIREFQRLSLKRKITELSKSKGVKEVQEKLKNLTGELRRLEKEAGI